MRESGQFEAEQSFVVRLRIAAANIALLGLLVSVGIALLRFANVSYSLLFGLVPIAPMVALVCLVLRGLLRGAKVFGLTLAVALVLGVLMLPGAVLPRVVCDIRATAAPIGPESIVVMSHNLLINNTELDAVQAQINAISPDVIALQEVSAAFETGLLEELQAIYPHVVSERNLMLLSKLPLGNVEIVYGGSEEAKPTLIATVDSPIGDVRVANFHADPPFRPELRANQVRQFDFLTNDPAAQDIDVLVGDFNAPSADKRYRQMRSTRFTDAHRVAGCGVGTTWSPLRSGPGILSIDHALIAEGFEATSFEIFDHAGSDHRAIAVRVTK